MHFRLSTLLLFFLLSSHNNLSRADDWPRWQGADNSSQWHEGEVITEFKDGKAKFEWRVPIGLGYSGPAVSDGKIYIMDYQKTSGEIANNPGGKNQLEGKERVLCFDFESGEQIWEYSYDRPYFLSYPAGPRCTTTVADGKVYALGAEGNLTCLDAEQGDVIWSKDLVQEYNTKSPIWGFSAHPLVHGDTLYCVVGGEGSVAVAFDKDTGKEKWRSLTAAEQGYCPPIMMNQAGVDQLIIWHPESINGLNPADGSLYWSLPLKPNYGMSIMTPRKTGNYLFASGHGKVGGLIELSEEEPTAKFVWQATPKQAVFAANSTPYILGDYIYGADIFSSSLICAKVADGERVWSDATAIFGEDPAPRGAKHGTAFLVQNTKNNLFYLFNELGHLVIAELTPEGYKEKSRAPILEPTNEAFGRPVVWSAPAFAGQSMIARNDKELVKVDLKQ